MISKNFKRTTCQIVLKYYTEIDAIPEPQTHIRTHTSIFFTLIVWTDHKFGNVVTPQLPRHVQTFLIQLAANIIEMGEIQTKHA